ncbi:MAG: ABC transporter ATP-binding protein [Burkholderiales bacterium]|nr:ABC transporter ATP-binding protein [Burkholderiales bacterium]
MPLLEAANLETWYGPVPALRGVSLNVEQGAIVAVLGANGAGKTTLLKTLGGALEPKAGSVRFDGHDITGRHSWEVARSGVIHVPEGREVFRHLSVRDNLAMGAYLRRDRDAIAADLAFVYQTFPRLAERAAQHAGNLSGGEQQMLAIGRALMARPRLLLLDEPSLGLAPLLVSEIFDVIRRLNLERGLTILLVEQNARQALALATSATVLELGRVVLSGSARELAENRDVREFYLGQGAQEAAGPRGERRWKRRKQWR